MSSNTNHIESETDITLNKILKAKPKLKNSIEQQDSESLNTMDYYKEDSSINKNDSNDSDSSIEQRSENEKKSSKVHKKKHKDKKEKESSKQRNKKEKKYYINIFIRFLG